MRILIIEARYYNKISENLLLGALNILKESKLDDIKIRTVPGALEIPLALELAYKSDVYYDGYIVLGCVIQGQTDHYQHVCDRSMEGIQTFSVRTLSPVGNGLLTCRDEKTALARCQLGENNAGEKAAHACLRMIALKREEQHLC